MSALALFSCPPLALFLLSSLLFLFHDPYLALFYRPGPRHLSFLQSETQGGPSALLWAAAYKRRPQLPMSVFMGGGHLDNH